MKEDILCLPNEVWKDIPNYELLYQASTLGRIRTHKDKVSSSARFPVRHWKQRIMRGRGRGTMGERVGLWKDGKCKDFLVARLIALTFLGTPQEGYTVNHINGDRFDNRLENLEWLSLHDNIMHAFNNELMPSYNVRLYNKDCDLRFRSLATASKYIGRCMGYLEKHKEIETKDGTKYFVEISPNMKMCKNMEVQYDKI